MAEQQLDPKTRETGGCPVNHNDYRLDGPVMSMYPRLDADREESAVFWNDTTERGFWMITRYAEVLEALQTPETFSNAQVNAFEMLPENYFLPNQLDQPQHAKIRKVLNPYFSPRAVTRMEDLAWERAIALIEEVRPKGECDFVTEFAIRYPTELFLALLGLPVDHGDFFVPWVEAIFAGLFNATDEVKQQAADANEAMHEYFRREVEDRDQNPRDPHVDLVTRLLQARIDGELIPRERVVDICFTLMVAGLDTTRSALGYMHYVLAERDDLRAQLTQDPSLWPKAIEEAIRVYGLVFEGGRIITEDTDFHGCPMKEGDLAWVGFVQASRDPRKFEDPTEFKLDRENLSHHLNWGAGLHRCIGMHLARSEMAIALQAWHERIPDYWVEPDVEIIERGGQLSLRQLPLRWEVDA